jgi:hypothetical protein
MFEVNKFWMSISFECQYVLNVNIFWMSICFECQCEEENQ